MENSFRLGGETWPECVPSTKHKHETAATIPSGLKYMQLRRVNSKERERVCRVKPTGGSETEMGEQVRGL